jgi:SAM-dependent methyltransferase
MEKIGTAKIVEIAAAYSGENFKSGKALADRFYRAKEDLLAQWQASLDKAGGPSGAPAYHLYHDPEYIYEGIHCFRKSKVGAEATVAVLTGESTFADGSLFDADLSKVSVLDIYNGVGLTTALLALNNIKVESFNDCEPQVRFMNVATDVLKLQQIPNHVEKPKKLFDVITSFEVFEHYSDPLIHLAEIISMLKPNGLLIESSGFNGSGDNIGHFDSYPIMGWLMPYRKARIALTNCIGQYFDRVQNNFNQNPTVWRRNAKPFVGFDRKFVAGACWDMFPKQYGFGSRPFFEVDGEIWIGDGDAIMDFTNELRSTRGLPSLFETGNQVYHCRQLGIYEPFFKKEQK